MIFETPAGGVKFDIPNDWWAFAEMEKFNRVGQFYYYGGQCFSDVAVVIDLVQVKPPQRDPGTGLFKKYKLLPVLFALTSPECSLPPITVERLLGSSFQFSVTNGFHRYYASVAVGFSKLPVVIEGG
jgi:hypothetical protein